MLVEERRPAVGDPQPLPDPVAEDEAGVEHADHGLRARDEIAVDVDQDLGVARIVVEVVCPVRGSHAAIIAGAVVGMAAAALPCRPRQRVRQWMQVGRLEPVPARRVRELDGVGPGTVLRGLTAEPGLVVLSGAWLDGGLVVARDPLRTADGAGLDDVFARPAARDEGGARLGGGWFGWLALPRTGRGAGRALRLVPERRALGPPHPHLVGRGSDRRRSWRPRPSTTGALRAARLARARRRPARAAALPRGTPAPRHHPRRLHRRRRALHRPHPRRRRLPGQHLPAARRDLRRRRRGRLRRARRRPATGARRAGLRAGPDGRQRVARAVPAPRRGRASRRRRSRAPGRGSGRPPSTATRPGCASRPRSGPRT